MNFKNIGPIFLLKSNRHFLVSSLTSLSLLFNNLHNLPTNLFNSIIKFSGGNWIINSVNAIDN